MPSLHEIQHFKHNVRMWRMNHIASKKIIRKGESKQFGEYTFTFGQAKHLKEIEALHLRLFRQPMLGWLSWVYRFHAKDLLSVVLDKEGKVVGYECFMFNEVEIADNIIHEVYVGVDSALQGKGIATALRKYSIASYDFGNLRAVSTVALRNDIKALRSAQKAGFAIIKQSLKPVGHYMMINLNQRLGA